MLETSREFAAGKLEQSREAPPFRRRHADFFLELAESANLYVEADGEQRHDLVISEQANVRAAIDWATEADRELALRLAVALENFWATNDPAEGRRRLENLLSSAENIDARLRSRATRAYAGMTQMTGDLAAAERHFEEALELARTAGDELGIAVLIFRLGAAAMNAGDTDRAKPLFEEGLARARRLGAVKQELQALGALGRVELESGDPARGREMLEESARMAHDVGFFWWEGGMLSALADEAADRGDAAEAEGYASRAVAVMQRIGDRQGLVWALAQVAWAAARSGDLTRAGLLWHAADAEARGSAQPWWDEAVERYGSGVPPVDGRVLSLDEAVEYALAERRV
jgi:tetratricopeptide (TPR) repeat protein